MSKESMAKSLVIAGVHRSGTSLTTNWLAECGLSLGTDLLEARKDNPKGFFEDTDFISFHQKLLGDNGLRVASTIKEGSDLKVNLNRVEEAKQLLKKFDNEKILSWKDPRTTIFLDLWDELIPDMKVLMVYRHYSNVVDSLVRRGQKADKKFPKKQISKIFFTKHNLPLLNRYLSCWNFYNLKMLDYLEKHPDNCVLLSLDQILEKSEDIVEFLNGKWNLGFEKVNINTIFEDKYLKGTEPKSFNFNKEVQSRSEDILERLNKLRTKI